MRNFRRRVLKFLKLSWCAFNAFNIKKKNTSNPQVVLNALFLPNGLSDYLQFNNKIFT
jgi:hypothetical protein